MSFSLVGFLEEAARAVAGKPPRPFLLYAAKKAAESELLAVEAPTGYGKTTLSMALSAESLAVRGMKSIVAYPTRTLIENQLGKFRAFFERLNIPGLPPGRLVGARFMGVAESRYFVRPVTLTTVDTLSLTALGLAPEDLEKAVEGRMGHYLFSRAMFSLSDLVLDEVHLLADTVKSLSFLAALLWLARMNGQRVVMLSATMPRAFVRLLEEMHVKVVKFKEEPDEEFLKLRREKKYSVDIEGLGGNWREWIFEWLKSKWRDSPGRAVLVFNTVERAVAFYDFLLDRLGELGVRREEALLLHSRFSQRDRERISKSLDGRWRLLVATQAVEVGVDVSATIFASELAPANSLVQRFGRFLRRDEEREGWALVWYDKEQLTDSASGAQEGKYTVYDRALVEKTLDALMGAASCPVFHDPCIYTGILDEVYHEEAFRYGVNYMAEIVNGYLDLSSVSGAVKTFLEQQGSLVREEAQVPAVAENVVEELLEGRVEELVVPVQFNAIEKRVRGVVVKGREGKLELKEVKRADWRLALSSDFVAFVVKGSYDRERGLVW